MEQVENLQHQRKDHTTFAIKINRHMFIINYKINLMCLLIILFKQDLFKIAIVNALPLEV